MGVCLHHLLPEDAYDQGPVVDARGRTLVADVRIDNRAELCERLRLGPTAAATLSDGRLLSLALVRWEDEALDHVVGDYAFALWDPADETLLLARDFAGQRPLHYYIGEELVAAASMPKGLHALPEVPRAPGLEAAAAFLARQPERRDESFFAGVKKVPPGHVVKVGRAGATSRRYWNPRSDVLRLPRDEDYVEAVRERLDQAVASRLRRSGGGVAAHLSGGLDSTNVAASAAIQLLDREPLLAFTSVPSAGLAGKACDFVDEGPAAAAVAALYPNMEHVLVGVGATSPLDALARNAFLYERPVLNLCNGVWVDAINQAARERGAKVLLTGSLGNAAFSFDGMALLAELLSRARVGRLAHEVAHLLKRGVTLRTVAGAVVGPVLPWSVWAAIGRVRGGVPEAQRPPLSAGGRRSSNSRPPIGASAMRMWMLARVDVGNYVKGTLGGWGIDRRDPTADRRLVELCLRIPADQFLRRGVRRSIAKRVGADRLPAVVLNEARKGRQAADWYEGMQAARHQFETEVEALARFPLTAELIDTRSLQALVDEWPERGWGELETAKRYRYHALRDISLGHFMRHAAGAN